jgi:hypothetical protein
MKPFIVVLALALGLTFVSIALAIQSDQFAFTSVPPNTSAVSSVRVRSAPTPDVAVLLRTIQAEEVLVMGELKPRRVPARRQASVSQTIVHVVPAPCLDGTYRKLEAKRGVRLSCPASL